MAAPIITSLSGGGKTASAVAFPKNTSGNSKTLPKPFRALAPLPNTPWSWTGVCRRSLPRVWPAASAAQLTSQHFWDHMERIQPETAQAIWQQLIAAVLQREQIALSQICYDGTNFYTFIDTFNLQSQLAKRGKNKQGRSNLRQVSYALFCTTDEHLPLFYDVYEGNRNQPGCPLAARHGARLGRDEELAYPAGGVWKRAHLGHDLQPELV